MTIPVILKGPTTDEVLRGVLSIEVLLLVVNKKFKVIFLRLLTHSVGLSHEVPHAAHRRGALSAGPNLFLALSLDLFSELFEDDLVLQLIY